MLTVIEYEPDGFTNFKMSYKHITPSLEDMMKNLSPMWEHVHLFRREATESAIAYNRVYDCLPAMGKFSIDHQWEAWNRCDEELKE